MSELHQNQAPIALIVTLCKSLNFGAYLQAYALQETVRKYGAEPVFLDVYDMGQNYKRLKSLVKRRSLNPKGISFAVKKFRAFVEAERRLNISKKIPSKVPLAILGSDEIWSIKNSSFNSVDEFFGHHLPSARTISYAPSAGNTEVQLAMQSEVFCSGVKGLDAVSVRDKNTLEIVRALGIEDATQVLDPAFLYEFSEEEPFSFDRPYVLVYSYGVKKDMQLSIKNFANRMGLVTVSAGFDNDWCDFSFPSSPFQFLSMVKNAEVVATDTFHGSVFSIKYRKNFVNFSSGKRKVAGLLEDLGLASVLVNESTLENVASTSTDYSNCEPVLLRKQSESLNFLKQNVEVALSEAQ